MKMNNNIVTTIGDTPLPRYAHSDDAAFDLAAADDDYLHPGDWHLVPTGVRIELPEGYAALVLPRSGTAYKQGLTVLNAPGLIDPGYRGEIKVALYNANRTVGREIRKGDRIAQLMVVPFVQVAGLDAMDEGERGDGGFGSTGV